MSTTVKLNDPEKAKKYFEDKMAFTTGPVELNRWLKGGESVVVVDTRLAEHYAQGHVPGAISLPKDKWESLAGLKKDKLHVLYCYSQVCHLAATSAIFFASKGYSVMELEGGFSGWQDNGLDVEKGTAVASLTA